MSVVRSRQRFEFWSRRRPRSFNRAKATYGIPAKSHRTRRFTLNTLANRSRRGSSASGKSWSGTAMGKRPIGAGRAAGRWVCLTNRTGRRSGYVGFGLLTGIGTERIGRYTYGKTPSVMLQLEIDYDDGSRQTIGSDETWKVTGNGPIRQADMLMGEFYDARMETPGWSKVGFDDSGWEPAILAQENEIGRASCRERV